MRAHTFLGTVFEVPERHRLHIVRDALVTVDSKGVIQRVLDPAKDIDYESVLREAESTGTLVRLAKGQYFLPGLVDLHVHAPQWPHLGKALDRSLESWLSDFTFPLEAKYEDIEFAAKSYNSLVSALLANGTTTVAYFATIHLEASVLLAKICLEKGQRGVIGRVAMDLPEQCPEYYRDASPHASVALSDKFIQEVRALQGNESGLVLPAVIPRFIPSCSHEALQGLGDLVRRYGCHVQTHCSESDWEHNHVLQRYKKTDAFALDDFGLITRRTVLNHSVYLSDGDMDLIEQRGAAVAHCPLSNFYFADAVFPLRKALDRGLRVGMGTDISGGPSASVFDVCRHAVVASRCLESGVDPSSCVEERSRNKQARINHIEAFYVATTLGGESLDLKVGRIAPGYYFDAIVVDTKAAHSNLHIFDEMDTEEDVFQKIMYNVGLSNIRRTYVNGQLVHEAQ